MADFIKADWHISPVSGLTVKVGVFLTHQTRLQILTGWRVNNRFRNPTGSGPAAERKLLRHVAGHHLAPTIIAANQHWLVVNWLEGDVVTNAHH